MSNSSKSYSSDEDEDSSVGSEEEARLKQERELFAMQRELNGLKHEELRAKSTSIVGGGPVMMQRGMSNNSSNNVMNPMSPVGQINPMNPMNPMNAMNQINQINPMNPINPMSPNNRQRPSLIQMQKQGSNLSNHQIPTPMPNPIQTQIPNQMPNQPRNSFVNQKRSSVTLQQKNSSPYAGQNYQPRTPTSYQYQISASNQIFQQTKHRSNDSGDPHTPLAMPSLDEMKDEPIGVPSIQTNQSPASTDHANDSNNDLLKAIWSEIKEIRIKLTNEQEKNEQLRNENDRLREEIIQRNRQIQQFSTNDNNNSSFMIGSEMSSNMNNESVPFIMNSQNSSQINSTNNEKSVSIGGWLFGNSFKPKQCC